MSINKLVVLGLAVFFSACSSDMFLTHNGNMPSNERIAQLKVGDTKQQVVQTLGAPSSVVSFDQNTWIYMSADVEQVAFFKPEEVDRDILIVRFDEQNKVKEIDRMSDEEGETVVVSEEETPTLGERPGFFKRVFGGVGAYSPFSGSQYNKNL